MKNTKLKEKLKANQLTIGSWITIGHPSIAEIMGNAGFEWLTIDMEHNSIDPTMMQTMIAIIQSKDIAALVRVPKNEEVAIKHAMDAGADGVIVPMINTKEDAAQAVNYVKYPPDGKRGVGLSRAQGYGFSFDEYKAWLKEYAVVIAQIEHIAGVKNIEEIIQVEGIDGIIIGPYDLSGSLGIPGSYNEPVVKEALTKVEKVCLAHKKSMGYHVIEPDSALVIEKQKAGYNFIAFSTDFLFLGQKAVEEMNKLRSLINE